MILAVLDHSLIPITISLTNAARIPFLFTFAWRIGLTAGAQTRQHPQTPHPKQPIRHRRGV